MDELIALLDEIEQAATRPHLAEHHPAENFQ